MNIYILFLIMIIISIVFFKQPKYEPFFSISSQPKTFALKIKPYHIVKTRPRYESDIYCYPIKCPDCMNRNKDKYSCWKCHIKG